MPVNNIAPASAMMTDAGFNIIDSRLEAVNLCMRAIGREGVDSLDSGDLDAEDANKMLDIVSQRVQGGDRMGGWWFNREPDWEIAPDSNGEINLPNNCMAVYQDYRIGDRKVHMTQRGRKLYCVTTHSYDMRNFVNCDGNMRFTFVMFLPYEHLPPNVMQAIAYQTAVEFIVSKDADKTKLQAHQIIAQQLLAGMMSEQAAQKELNMFVHNPTQRLFGTMAGGYQNVPAFSHAPYDNSLPRIVR